MFGPGIGPGFVPGFAPRVVPGFGPGFGPGFVPRFVPGFGQGCGPVFGPGFDPVGVTFTVHSLFLPQSKNMPGCYLETLNLTVGHLATSIRRPVHRF